MIDRLTDRTKALGSRIRNNISKLLIHTVTLPYSRFFEFHTLGPIRRVASYHNNPDKQPNLVIVLTKWRERKLAELQYISIASTVLAAAVIGSFSWNDINDSYWLASACWYCSLVLSVLGILLAAQQTAVLNLLGNIPKDPTSAATMVVVDRYLPLLITGARRVIGHNESQKRVAISSPCNPRWHMVFTWQCPVMFMSYSVCTFLLGLTVLVVTPLIRLGTKGWDGDATVAVVYLVIAGSSVTMFMFCSFWVYHYIQLDTETLLDEDEDATIAETITVQPYLTSPMPVTSTVAP